MTTPDPLNERRAQELAEVIASHVAYFNGWWVDAARMRGNCLDAAREWLATHPELEPRDSPIREHAKTILHALQTFPHVDIEAKINLIERELRVAQERSRP